MVPKLEHRLRWQSTHLLWRYTLTVILYFVWRNRLFTWIHKFNPFGFSFFLMSAKECILFSCSRSNNSPRSPHSFPSHAKLVEPPTMLTARQITLYLFLWSPRYICKFKFNFHLRLRNFVWAREWRESPSHLHKIRKNTAYWPPPSTSNHTRLTYITFV